MFRGFGFPGADDMGNMFQFKRDFEDEYVGARDLEVARSLNPELQTSTRGWPRTRTASRSRRPAIRRPVRGLSRGRAPAAAPPLAHERRERGDDDGEQRARDAE